MDGSELPTCRRLDFELAIVSRLDINPNAENDGKGDCLSSLTNVLDDLAIDQIHSKICKTDIPKVGMEFKSDEEAYQFYRAYAKKVGFGSRWSRSHKDNLTKAVLDRTFCCCEGKRRKDKRDANVKNSLPESRCFCLAKMRVSCRRLSTKYEVVEFMAEHNHSFTTPSKTHLHRSHRKISPAQAAEADMTESSDILEIDGNSLPKHPKEEEAVGIITMENVIEELLQIVNNLSGVLILCIPLLLHLTIDTLV